MILLELTAQQKAQNFYHMAFALLIIMSLMLITMSYIVIKDIIKKYKADKKRLEWTKGLNPGDQVETRNGTQGIVLSTEGGVFRLQLEEVEVKPEDIFEPTHPYCGVNPLKS